MKIVRCSGERTQRVVEAAGDGTGGALHVQTHEVVADMKRGRVRNAIEL